jgi:hypothetical protein
MHFDRFWVKIKNKKHIVGIVQKPENKRSSNMSPTKNRGELMCSGRVSSSYYTSGTEICVHM